MEEFLPRHEDMVEYLDPDQLRDVMNADTPYVHVQNRHGFYDTIVEYKGREFHVFNRTLSDCVSTGAGLPWRPENWTPVRWAERGKYLGAVVTSAGIAVLHGYSDG